MKKRWLGLLSILSLLLCLAAPILYFLDALPEGRFKLALLGASLCWFVFATLWAAAGKAP